MNHGLSEKTVKQIFSVFEGFPEVEKAVLYGSRAKGNFKTGSDIDLTLYGEKLSARLLGDIAEALDDLLLPYTIDLSIFDDLNHAKLREHIERVGVVFYEKKRQNMKAGWEIKTFEDCIEKVAYTPKIQRKDFLDDGIYPIVSQEDAFINGYWDNEADLFKVETPVVVFGDHTKVLKYIDFDFVLGADGVKILQTKNFLLPKFLFYRLQSETLDSLGYARHYKLLKELQIAYPEDKSEQKRLVTLLDEAFESIATAKANTELNLKNARALFESYLNEIFTKRGEGWEDKQKPLADLCELIVDCEHKTAPTQEQGIPSIRTPNIGKGKLLLDGVYRVSEETYSEWTKRAEPRAGDLILAREAPAGNVAIIPENMRVCLGQRTVLIRPKTDIFESAFLSFLLLSSAMRDKLLAHSRGATVQHINMKDIRALEIGAIPTVDIQKSIVEKLNAADEETQRLESIYQRKLAALEELKKALLHRAFSGEL